MRLSYSLQRDEYADALQAITDSINEQPVEQRRARLRNWVVVGYHVALVIAVIALIHFFPDAAVGVIILAVLTVLLQSIAKSLIDRLAVADFGAAFEPRRHHEITAVFDTDTVSYVGQEHRHSLRWTLLRRLHDLSKVYVLEFVAFDIIIVPKRAFASANEERAWLAEVRKHIH